MTTRAMRPQERIEGFFDEIIGGPNGTRTRVFGVRGRYPRPLDDGTTHKRKMAGGLGFEPRLTGPEPVVLPLDDPPAGTLLIFWEIYAKCQEKTRILELLSACYGCFGQPIEGAWLDEDAADIVCRRNLMKFNLTFQASPLRKWASALEAAAWRGIYWAGHITCQGF